MNSALLWSVCWAGVQTGQSRIIDTGCTNWLAHQLAFRIVIHRFKTVDTKAPWNKSSYREENICTPSQVTALIFWRGRFLALFTEPALNQTHLFHTPHPPFFWLRADVCKPSYLVLFAVLEDWILSRFSVYILVFLFLQCHPSVHSLALFWDASGALLSGSVAIYHK